MNLLEEYCAVDEFIHVLPYNFMFIFELCVSPMYTESGYDSRYRIPKLLASKFDAQRRFGSYAADCNGLDTYGVNAVLMLKEVLFSLLRLI